MRGVNKADRRKQAKALMDKWEPSLKRGAYNQVAQQDTLIKLKQQVKIVVDRKKAKA